MSFFTAALYRACLPLAMLALVTACDEPPAPQPEVRWVRTMIVRAEPLARMVSQVGEIQPRYESDLAFQIPGRILTRPASLGMVVRKGDILARLDEQVQRSQTQAAEAELAATRAVLTQAAAEERRQQQLRINGWAAEAKYEDARRARQTAEANVGAAEAKLRVARDHLNYTLLRAPEDGVITALGAEAGQVVGAGQMVVRLARLDEKDAVFHLSETLLPALRPDADVTVSLLDAPAVTARGKPREIAPSADPATRTYTVKVSLSDAPADMRFGMTAVGRISESEARVMSLPASALFQQDGVPAVWVFDSGSQTVSLNRVEIFRMDPDRVLIGGGLEEGSVVVTAGVQRLRPGQKVRLQEQDAGGGR